MIKEYKGGWKFMLIGRQKVTGKVTLGLAKWKAGYTHLLYLATCHGPAGNQPLLSIP